MARFFNTAGPVNPDKHYAIPPLLRWDLGEILDLIDQEKYFILHAPRQTGKTSGLLALRNKLNQEGRYYALYINVEGAQAWRENINEAMRSILGEIGKRFRQEFDLQTKLDFIDEWVQRPNLAGGLNLALSRLSSILDRPLVLFVDEIDSLIGDTLVAVLRQLRAGYDSRPKNFPQSVILCGVRDIRDYRIHSSTHKEIITGGSAFNIKAESLRLGGFSRAEVSALLAQHTQTTGQVFQPDSIDEIWRLSMGQPWLVNALAYQICWKSQPGKIRTNPITREMVKAAKEDLILSRATHLDQLADKLGESRVRRIIQPLLVGGDGLPDVPHDDIEYLIDLGLLRRTPNNAIEIANPIYREILPRELASSAELMIPGVAGRDYVGSDGKLLLPKLLLKFQQFFRENFEHWREGYDYKEAGFQLLMQAFLHRVVNGGGRIEREYGLGRGRTDLFIHWPHPGGIQRMVVELKILRKSRAGTIREGLLQTWEYADRCGADEAHLVIFEETKKPWNKKIFRKTEKYNGTEIGVWGV